MAEQMKLTTTYQWKAPGMTEFEVQFGAGQLDQLWNVRVSLYDAGTDEQLAAFTAADDDDNWWICATEITPAEDCTMHFYARMEAKLKNANTDTAVVMQSNTVTIEFSQTPPPA